MKRPAHVPRSRDSRSPAPPARIKASPEEIARAVLSTPAKKLKEKKSSS